MASAGEERHMLISFSQELIIRVLWDPFTNSKVNILQGHSSSVQDLALNEERNQLISLGVDKVL